MSKILKNTTGSAIAISDTGVTIGASPATYTIPPTDYLLWAASDNIVTEIGSGNIVVNDGSVDLGISDGTDLIKGIFPSEVKISLGDNNVNAAGTHKNPIQTHNVHNVHAAFGELMVTELQSYASLDPTSGLDTRTIETFNNGTGSKATIDDNNPGREFSAHSGTTIGGYGVVRSKRSLTYRPGIGSLARFTARFSTPVANSIQRAGMFNIGNELTFGHDGDNGFGILRKTGARPEIRKLTINTSSNQNTTATVTLNGTSQTVSITNSSAEQNAFEIVNNYNWLLLGWSAYNVDNTIYFQSRTSGSKSGTYSATASGNFDATFTQTEGGSDGTQHWAYQADWNGDTLQSESDTFILDPTKGNVYQIQYQYLGYGALKFYIENPENGRFVLVHTIKYSNSNTTPSLDVPTFKIGIIAASEGSTTDVSVHAGSLALFHESAIEPPKNISAFRGEVGGVGTTLTNVVACKKITISNETLNITDIVLEEITAASEGTKPVIFDVLLNPTFANNTLWEDTNSNTPLLATSTGGAVTGGTLLYSIALSKSSNIKIDLTNLNIVLTNDDIICVAARATSGNTDAVATIMWGGK